MRSTPLPRLRIKLRWTLLLVLGSFLAGAQRSPMAVDYQNSAAYRWLNKKVLESRLLDDMESLEKWTAFTRGAPAVVDARVSIQRAAAPKMVAEMTLTRERSRDGGQSLRFRQALGPLLLQQAGLDLLGQAFQPLPEHARAIGLVGEPFGAHGDEGESGGAAEELVAVDGAVDEDDGEDKDEIKDSLGGPPGPKARHQCPERRWMTITKAVALKAACVR